MLFLLAEKTHLHAGVNVNAAREGKPSVWRPSEKSDSCICKGKVAPSGQPRGGIKVLNLCAELIIGVMFGN